MKDKNQYHYSKLCCIANQIYKNEENLYVWFRTNRKKILNRSCWIIKINDGRNKYSIDEIKSNFYQNVYLTYIFALWKFRWFCFPRFRELDFFLQSLQWQMLGNFGLYAFFLKSLKQLHMSSTLFTINRHFT